MSSTPPAPRSSEADDDGLTFEYLHDEGPVVNWPALLRERLARRIDQREDRYRWMALATTLVGVFAVGFAITVISVSLRTIADDLGTTPSGLTWSVTGPMLVSAVTVPLAGKLGDLHGHRRIYLVGFAVFAVFTLASALAWSAVSLTALRSVAAFGGAAMAPTSMAIVMHHFTGDDRVRAMGWWSLVGAGAPVIGLAAGGPIVDAFGWRWIFLLQGAAAVVALGAAVVVLRDTEGRPGARLDLAGAALLAVGTVGVLLALQRGGTAGWARPEVLLAVVVGLVALVGFVRVEQRVREPVLPLRFFAARGFRASVVAQFASNFAYMGSFIVTPLLVHDLFGFGVGATAAAMACRPLTFSLTSPVAGYAAVRFGERRLSVAGMVCVVVSMAAFAVAAAQAVLALVFVGLVLAGLGMGMASPSLVSIVGDSVDPASLGAANAAQSMITQIGVVAGIQILTTIQAAGEGSGAFVAAYLAAAVMAVVAVLAARTIAARSPAP